MTSPLAWGGLWKFRLLQAGLTRLSSWDQQAEQACVLPFFERATITGSGEAPTCSCCLSEQPWKVSFNQWCGQPPWGDHVPPVILVEGNACTPKGALRFGHPSQNALPQGNSLEREAALSPSVQTWVFPRRRTSWTRLSLQLSKAYYVSRNQFVALVGLTYNLTHHVQNIYELTIQCLTYSLYLRPILP